MLRASIIRSSQLAIKLKYYILDELEEREEKWILMQELALARALRHIVRVSSGPYIYKVVVSYS
jgi:hypothetical protein